MIILHFTEKHIWEEEEKNNCIGQSAIDEHEFIPCYQIPDIKSFNLSLSTLNDYIVLCIDTDKVTADIKFGPYGKIEFCEPCIYGTIPREAVIDVLPYTFDSNDKFVLTPTILNYDLIGRTCDALKIGYESHKSFNDGSTNTIILLNDKYVIKKTEPGLLKANAIFAKFYGTVPYLQKVAYEDENDEFVVFDYIPGDVMHTVSNFEDLSSKIKTLTSYYKPYSFDGFGYIHDPLDTWGDFLGREVSRAREMFSEADYLLPEVQDAVSFLAKTTFEKKLIHGDFGTDNFIATDDKFIAAIDPLPLVGDVTYDILYALVSNVDLLPFISIDFLTSYTKESKEKIIAMLKVVLYTRICKSVKYDKECIETYFEFWDRIF